LSDSTACEAVSKCGAQSVIRETDFVSDEQLLDGGEVLKRREQHVSVLWTTNILDKPAKLVAESGQDLVFILDRFFAQC
jgi:hypothetical protein